MPPRNGWPRKPDINAKVCSAQASSSAGGAQIPFSIPASQPTPPHTSRRGTFANTRPRDESAWSRRSNVNIVVDVDEGPYDVVTGHAGARWRWVDVRPEAARLVR